MLKIQDLKKIVIFTLLASLSISAAIGIFIFLFGEMGNTEARILLTAGTIGWFSLMGLAYAAASEKKKNIAVLGIGFSIAGFAYTSMLIWEIIAASEDTIKVLAIIIIVSFGTAHGSLLWLITPKNNSVKLALFSTLILIGTVTVMLIYLIINYGGFDVNMFIRILGALAILDALGTVITPILNKVLK